MKYLVCGLVITALVLCHVTSVSSKDYRTHGLRYQRLEVNETDLSLLDPGLQTLTTTAAADTYCMVWYDFEFQDWQGWDRVDNTAQVDTFFHVDDFSGLGGGAFNRLVALEG